MNPCSVCGAKAQYRDRRNGSYLCLEHARLEVAAGREGAPRPALTIRPAAQEDRSRIEELALYFWDETEVECFDRKYDATSCPAFLACDGETVVGLASFAAAPDLGAVVVVMLNVLPDWQGRGGGRALLDAVCDEAARRGLRRVLVATTNDDLPALALYQRGGFRILELLPGRVARHHGGELPGFAGIPVRDEIRLEYLVG